jgi:hypothetical protein
VMLEGKSIVARSIDELALRIAGRGRSTVEEKPERSLKSLFQAVRRQS